MSVSKKASKDSIRCSLYASRWFGKGEHPDKMFRDVERDKRRVPPIGQKREVGTESYLDPNFLDLK